MENATPAGTITNAIVNFCVAAGNGPGCNKMPWKTKNTHWVPAIAALTAAEVKPMGYTWSNYDKTAPGVDGQPSRRPGRHAGHAGQTASGMEADLSHAQTEGVAHFYEGTDTLYATLPAFFAQEVTAVAGA